MGGIEGPYGLEIVGTTLAGFEELGPGFEHHGFGGKGVFDLVQGRPSEHRVAKYRHRITQRYYHRPALRYLLSRIPRLVQAPDIPPRPVLRSHYSRRLSQKPH